MRTAQRFSAHVTAFCCFQIAPYTRQRFSFLRRCHSMFLDLFVQLFMLLWRGAKIL